MDVVSGALSGVVGRHHADGGLRRAGDGKLIDRAARADNDGWVKRAENIMGGEIADCGG